MPLSTIATVSPRDDVCAVPYSQLSPEPVPGASSLHCCRAGCELSIAQKAVTVPLVVSLRPTRSPAAAALCSSAYVHTCSAENPRPLQLRRGDFAFSSFSKQPLVGSLPPSN